MKRFLFHDLCRYGQADTDHRTTADHGVRVKNGIYGLLGGVPSLSSIATQRRIVGELTGAATLAAHLNTWQRAIPIDLASLRMSCCHLEVRVATTICSQMGTLQLL